VSSLGETIKGVRQSKGLSRAELAVRAGISHVFVGKIEQGDRRPSPSTLRSIAAVLGVTVTELTTRAEVLNAFGSLTSDELTSRLLRTVTIGSKAPSALARSAFGATPLGVGVIAAQAYLLLRKQRAAAGPLPSPDGLSARERLHALVEQLSESDAEKVLEVIDPDGDGLPAR
jgi:transcriptional regulator with XRE-family HTH domain